MAPTVCSEKKMRVSGMKEARRRSNMGVVHANATTSTGATQTYVAKGSTNSAGRQHRRRASRQPSRLTQISKRVKSAVNARTESRQSKRMELHGLANGRSTQPTRTHSSSTNIKTVLQPTTANSSNSNCNGNGNNKTTTGKLCDQVSGMEDEEEEEQDDGDSGYAFSFEPIKPLYTQQQQQYYTHNQGLLSIAIKTIKLVERNKLLQKRLAQLQLETSEFISSVLANPENRHFRDKISAKTDPANKVSNVLLRH